MKIFITFKNVFFVTVLCFFMLLNPLFAETSVVLIEQTLSKIINQVDFNSALLSQKESLEKIKADVLQFYKTYEQDTAFNLCIQKYPSYSNFITALKALYKKDGSSKKIQAHHMRKLRLRVQQLIKDLTVYIGEFEAKKIEPTKIASLYQFKTICELLHLSFFKEEYFLPITTIEIFKDLLLHRSVEKIIEYKKTAAVAALVITGMATFKFLNSKKGTAKTAAEPIAASTGISAIGPQSQSIDKCKIPVEKKGGVVIEVLKGTEVKYEAEGITRGFVHDSTVYELKPALDAYDIQICQVPKQNDSSSCGQRAITVAAYAIKALREKRNCNDKLLDNTQDQEAFNVLLNNVFKKIPAFRWTHKGHLDDLVDTTFELHQELKSKDVADFLILESDASDATINYQILLHAHTDGNAIDSHQINRFRNGIPQFFTIYIPGKHWITIKVELKRVNGQCRPLVTTFDGLNWNHTNQSMINTILFILTEGTPYQVGTVEHYEMGKKPLELVEYSVEDIARHIGEKRKLTDLYKQEQPNYKAACRQLNIND